MNSTRMGMTAPARRHRPLSSTASARPLPEAQRSFFETAFGQDFSQVRVHTDPSAGDFARLMRAKAVTSGEDIVFAPGRYQPGTVQGRTLLGHELAHVAQQQRGGSTGSSQAEPRARAAAETVAQGGEVSPESLGGAQQGLYCDPEDESKKIPYGPLPSVLPPMPNFQLSTLPPLDYFKFQGIAGAHTQRFSERDSTDMGAEWKRSAAMLRLFGLDHGLHLGPFSWTGDELLNIGLGKQYQDRLARESPNSWDRLNKQWDLANPGAFMIPPSLFSKTFTF